MIFVITNIKKMKKILFLTILLSFIGCGLKTNNHKWLEGKRFSVKSSSSYVSNNPEEFGHNFLDIKTIKNGEMKIGDIIDIVTISIKKDSLFAIGRASHHNYKFVIKDNKFLVDEYGNKWEVE
jgi:hypothetical protein